MGEWNRESWGFMKDFIMSHLNFKFYNVLWVPIIIALLTVPFMLYLPEEYGYENSLLETTQLVILALTFIFALKAKVNKTFFKCMAMIIGILFLREINCGRTIFFPVPGEVNTFYSWKEIKYGWLAHPLYGLYMAFTVLYFLKNKLFMTLWNYVKGVRFPFWSMFFIFLGMAIGLYAEKTMNNMILEEMAELLFYTALMCIVYLYGFNKDYEMSESVDITEFSGKDGTRI